MASFTAVVSAEISNHRFMHSVYSCWLVGRWVRALIGGVKGHAHARRCCQMSERENMELDVLMLCGSDQHQQQRNDDNILSTIEGELLDEEVMSELATAESPSFDESRIDDSESCQSDLPSRDNEEMLTPDDRRPGGVALGSDSTGPFEDESAGSSDVCVLQATLGYTPRSDVVESQEETVTDGAAAEKRNCSDCAVGVCSDNSVSDVDYVVDSVSDDKCDSDDVSESTCSVSENYGHNAETVSITRLRQDGQSETSSVNCAETTSAVSVIDTYAVLDQSDVDSADTEPGNMSSLHSADAVGLSNEAERLKLEEAVDIEAKKKGFRVRFHDDHVVTGYHDPPTPWREGWQHSSFLYTNLLGGLL